MGFKNLIIDMSWTFWESLSYQQHSMDSEVSESGKNRTHVLIQKEGYNYLVGQQTPEVLNCSKFLGMVLPLPFSWGLP